MYLRTHSGASIGVSLWGRRRVVDQSRFSKLTHLQFQIRSLKQRERSLVFLCNKNCQGNRAEAERDLLRTRKHIKEAEAQMSLILRRETPS